MSPLIVLSLGKGNCQSGLPEVKARLWQEGTQTLVKSGSLPPAPKLPQLYKRWQLFYEALHDPLGHGRLRGAIEFESGAITNVSRNGFREVCDELKKEIDDWLNSPGFRGIDQQLRTRLNPKENIRIILETEDFLLQKLPWYVWKFLEHYDRAEIAISAQDYEQVNGASTRLDHRMRVLVVLGHSNGIDIQPDRLLLEELDAETVVLKEPTRANLDKHLWEEKGWDIFFFAGHSTSQGENQTEELSLSADEKLSIDQLKNALKTSIKRGLKLAIFNSCDGVGLARALASLNLPQLIVMREPVVDPVAHIFLENFLQVFSSGEPFYTAVRSAREQLQGIESKFPGASWLPVIFQNPTETPITWGVGQGSFQPSNVQALPGLKPLNAPAKALKAIGLRSLLLVSVLVAAPIALVRTTGLLQPLELSAYDHLMRSRPVAWDTKPDIDPRLLVVEITEADIDRYGYPVSDQILATAIQQLQQHQPTTIGIDLHRFQENPPGREQLINQFQESPNLITVCSFGLDARAIMSFPPEFSPDQAQNQVGFSDLETDEGIYGGRPVVRRQLLSYDAYLASDDATCTTPYSFSMNLALRYLQAEGTNPLGFNDDSNWQLGTTVFERLNARTGAYQWLDGRLSQILLNYRANPMPAQRRSLTDVLEGDFEDSLIRNRIVLLGITDEHIGNDYRQTPYGTLPGVWVHAHGVSQVLGAVLDERPLIGGLPQWGQMQWADMVWIWGWALAGGLLAWRIRSLVVVAGAGVVIVVLLRQVCLMILVEGIWVPLIPALAAFVGTAAVVWALNRGYVPFKLPFKLDIPLNRLT